MRIALVALAALALAALTYLWLERLGRRALLPMLLRAVAWACLLLLLLNVSCPRPATPGRPLVLLDASLSMTAGGQWAAARDSALRTGEVRTFGDERGGTDTLPRRGRSLLAPALTAAAASDRPVWVLTDGEVEDAAELPRDLVGRAGVALFPRARRGDLAVTRLVGPARVTTGDSLVLEADVRVVGDTTVDSVAVDVRAGTAPAGAEARPLARRRIALRGGAGRARLVVPAAALRPGEQLLSVGVPAGDAEPRTDRRLHLIRVTATPGVLLLASPGDWDARFLYRALESTTELPVRGYVMLQPGRWRSMRDLSTVNDAEVRRAARGAELLVLKGADAELARGSGARGVWLWPSGEGGETVLPGDWYLQAPSTSPVAGAFLDAPLDSFPPGTRLVPVQPAPGAWVGLTAQEGRRGPERPAVVGSQEGRTRRVTVAIDGLWRWAFRGGSSEGAYRSWVAATASWLLGGADSARGLARPARAVVQNGRPVTFEWVGAGRPRPLTVALEGTGSGGAIRDTLRFDGAGRAQLWLPVGAHRWRLGDGGGAGLAAVEAYSDELLPRTVALAAKPPRTVLAERRSAARDWLWLFGLCVLALSGEWLARRRLGLR